MSGRGRLDEVADLQHPDLYMWRAGEWMPAKEPLHTDKPIAAAGLGMSFGVEVLRRTSLAPVGLVPCAVGGSPLSRWMPSGDLYETAVREAKAALAKGRLSGMLWHQGEHDSCSEELAETYADRLKSMIGSLRAELNAETVPFISGELGPFLHEFPQTKRYEMVNSALRGLEKEISNYACVSAAGMRDNGDNLHLNAVSLREFGVRYADAFEQLAAN